MMQERMISTRQSGTVNLVAHQLSQHMPSGNFDLACVGDPIHIKTRNTIYHTNPARPGTAGNGAFSLIVSWRDAANETFGRTILKLAATLRDLKRN